MKVLVGLGNPGAAYVATRHNMGFLIVRETAKRHGVRLSRPYAERGRLLAYYGEWTMKPTRVRGLLPQTMMNASGDALTAMDAWAVSPDEMLIVCDDVNLPLGTLRLRADGGAGGHHGLASCLEALGTQQVARLRVGVGVVALPNDLTEFVLSPFEDAERPMMRAVIARAAEACESWVEEGIEVTMNRVNAERVA